VAHHTLEADLPWIELPGGFKIVFEARSPTADASITGVTVTDVAIYAEDINASGLLTRIIPVLTSEQVGNV